MRFKLLRPIHWTKNLLLLAPLLVSQQLNDFNNYPDLLLGLLTFCLIASAGYIINDFRDRESDRSHPFNRTRAQAQQPYSTQKILQPIAALYASTLFLLIILKDREFALWVGLYILLSLSYSIRLKHLIVVDIICLTAFYLIRIFAGAAITSIPPSNWLLSFSFFIFLSLALLKRYSELQISKLNQLKIHRPYKIKHIKMVSIAAGVCFTFSFITLLLYILSFQSSQVYRSPDLLWLILACLLFWYYRLWKVAEKAQLKHDIFVFAAKDPSSIGCGLFTLATLFLARFI